eukprot:scaffold47_cov258-Pinguiococcus_pyrenoidosus.AAC.36
MRAKRNGRSYFRSHTWSKLGDNRCEYNSSRKAYHFRNRLGAPIPRQPRAIAQRQGQGSPHLGLRARRLRSRTRERAAPEEVRTELRSKRNSCARGPQPALNPSAIPRCDQHGHAIPCSQGDPSGPEGPVLAERGHRGRGEAASAGCVPGARGASQGSQGSLRRPAAQHQRETLGRERHGRGSPAGAQRQGSRAGEREGPGERGATAAPGAPERQHGAAGRAAEDAGEPQRAVGVLGGEAGAQRADREPRHDPVPDAQAAERARDRPEEADRRRQHAVVAGVRAASQAGEGHHPPAGGCQSGPQHAQHVPGLGPAAVRTAVLPKAEPGEDHAQPEPHDRRAAPPTREWHLQGDAAGPRAEAGVLQEAAAQAARLRLQDHPEGHAAAAGRAQEA